ncbi:MAG: hypothetical protein MZU84_03640 [Sphingobacterium sp.]|nr:hypothetical protein [Sphingobacterium sp.]
MKKKKSKKLNKSISLMFSVPLAISLCLLPVSPSFALPKDASVIDNSASISSSATKMDITQQKENAIINWKALMLKNQSMLTLFSLLPLQEY